MADAYGYHQHDAGYNRSQNYASGVPSASSWVNVGTPTGKGRRPLPQPRPRDVVSGTSSSFSAGPPIASSSRPLPEPTYSQHSYSQHSYSQHRVPVQYDGYERDDNDVADFGHVPRNDQREDPTPMHPLHVTYIPSEDHEPIEVPGSPSAPVIVSKNTAASKGFVGGFFKGLKRLPKLLKGGGNASANKKEVKRQATFGTDNTGTTPTITAVPLTRGNTLPRYLSNPSIGPSNPQFAHRLSMAPQHSDGDEATPRLGALQVRNNAAGPQFPTVTVSPPSDGYGDGEHADYYDGTSGEPVDNVLENMPSLRERATVMVYTNSQAPTITAPPIHEIPEERPVTMIPTPRVSYAVDLPTRATTQATQGVPMSVVPIPSEPQERPVPGPSTVTVEQPQMEPASRYHPRVSSPISPRSILSPKSTSAYTMSMAQSFYDPSFSGEHLTPFEKFFKGLYHLPWVGQERITVDYRPGDSARAKSKMRMFNRPKAKPMPSWYRAVVSRSRRMSKNLDLLSSGASSSLGNELSPIGSPTSYSRPLRRSPRSSIYLHRHTSRGRTGTTKPRTRDRNRATTTSESHSAAAPQAPQPAAYPYPFPQYPYPYAYPYGAYPPPPPQMPMPAAGPSHRTQPSHRRHKGSRRRHHDSQRQQQPEYAPYQPMAMPPMNMMPMPMNMYATAPAGVGQPPPMQVGVAPNGGPVYFITPSPPQSDTGQGPGGSHEPPAGQGQGQGQSSSHHAQPMQASPMYVQMAPYPSAPRQQQDHGSHGSRANKHNTMTPPLTPQKAKATNYAS